MESVVVVMDEKVVITMEAKHKGKDRTVKVKVHLVV